MVLRNKFKRFLTYSGFSILMLAPLALLPAQEKIEKKNHQIFWTNIPKDLKEYIKIALKNSPQIKSDTFRWQSVKARYGNAISLPDPMLNIAYMIEPIETKTGPQRSQISLVQRFPWFGVRKTRGHIVLAEATRANQMLKANVYRLVKNVKVTYYNYSYLGKQLSITEDNLKLLQHLEPVINKKLQVGGRQSDLLKLQIVIDKLEQKTLTIKRERVKLSAHLSTLIGINSENPIAYPELLKRKYTIKNINKEFDQWKELVFQNNPLLKVKKQNIEVAHQRLKLAKIQRRPKFSVGLKYMVTDDDRSSLNDAGTDPFGIAVGFTIPLWSKKYKSKINTAYFQKEQQTQNYESHILKLNDQWETIRNNLLDLNSKIKLYGEKIIPKAKQIIDIDIVSYSANKISIQDLIDSIRTYLQYEDKLWFNVKKWEEEIAKLEALTGGENYETTN